jgi:Xaa-Pro aminopeptidase
MADKAECNRRIALLQERLITGGIDGALLIYPIDIYYYAATRQNSALWIPADGAPRLMVRKSLSRAEAESTVETITAFPSGKAWPEIIGGQFRRIGLTYDVLPLQQFNFYGKILPNREFVDISALLRELRSVKSTWELERMRHSGRQLCAVFAEIPEFLRPGMREIDLSAEFEYRARKRGWEGYVRMRAFNQELFQGLAVAGPSAASPGFFDGAVTGRGLSAAAPHGASTATIDDNVPIMVDYTGVFDGYLIDMTRLFVFGALPPRVQEAFDAALSIQKEIVAALVPGAICSDLFIRASEMAQAAGFGDNFMGVPGEQAKFVGHGVGLELDEMPVLALGFNVPLVENQTIAIEPKFVFPGVGVAGIENTFAVGARGGEKLTPLPDSLVRL